MGMDIIKAGERHFETVRFITRQTIREIYPHYYPEGAVAFFLAHHSDPNILRDIQAGCVFLLLDQMERAVGTVTIRESGIYRLFVLPECQGMGYGRALLDFAEKRILGQYREISLDASLPAKPIYRKRGYAETEFHSIRTENGDFLCYDVMQKKA